MASLEDLYPQAWDALTPDERQAVATGAYATDDVARKLSRYSTVAHWEWTGAPGSGRWIVVQRFAEYVRDRLKQP